MLSDEWFIWNLAERNAEGQGNKITRFGYKIQLWLLLHYTLCLIIHKMTSLMNETTFAIFMASFMMFLFLPNTRSIYLPLISTVAQESTTVVYSISNSTITVAGSRTRDTFHPGCHRRSLHHNIPKWTTKTDSFTLCLRRFWHRVPSDESVSSILVVKLGYFCFPY